QTQPSASPEPACAAPTLRAAPPAQQSLPAEEPSRPAFQSTELADGSFETKLEVVKEARRSPDDDIEASKSATLQRKLDKAKEVSSKSATLQKKLKEAKAGRAASPARAEAQPVAASSESSAATTVSKTAILQKKLDEARRSVLLKTAAEEVPDKAMQANEDVEMQESLEESTFKMKTGDEAAIKATSSRPSSPDKQDNMEARVADMMELQEAAKSRRRGVVEKAKSVNQGEGSSASRREKRTADDMEETRTPKKKRDEETKGQEEPRQVRRASLFLKGAKKMTAGSAPQKQAVESESTDHGKDAPARERGARPKAWSKPAAQDDVSLDTGAEERPFNVFRAKVDVSDGFADSGKPKTQPQSKPPDFKEKEFTEGCLAVYFACSALGQHVVLQQLRAGGDAEGHNCTSTSSTRILGNGRISLQEAQHLGGSSESPAKTLLCTVMGVWKPSSAAELVDFEQQLEQFRGNTLKEMTDEFQDIRAWQQMLFDCEHLLEQRSFKAQALTAAAWESPDFQRAAEVLTTPSSGVRGCPVNPERGHLQALQMAVEWTIGGFDTRPVPEAAEKKQRDRLEILLHYRQPEEEAGMMPRVRMYDYLCDTLFHVPMKIVGPEVVIPEFRDLDGQLVKPVWMEADFSGAFERPKPVFAANRYPYQLPERPGKSPLQQRAQHWLLWYLHYPWEEARLDAAWQIFPTISSIRT
ncbi:unnamed protein product, partial [Symbiodinium sp. KB8]